MLPRNKNTARKGYSLLELLVVVVAFGMLVNVLMIMFTSASRLAAYNSQKLHRVSTAGELGQEFNELVRQSAGVADGVGAYQNDLDTLVLQLPGREGVERFAVLGLLRQPNRLSRMDFAVENGETSLTYYRTYPMPLERVAFTTNGREVTLEALPPKKLRRQEEGALVFRATPRAIVEDQS
jgi:prepilin-type N-terminal cleavage/methylation domain-containing protein